MDVIVVQHWREENHLLSHSMSSCEVGYMCKVSPNTYYRSIDRRGAGVRAKGVVWVLWTTTELSSPNITTISKQIMSLMGTEGRVFGASAL